MRPDPETNNAFIYCLAVAAERYEVDVLFTIANTNHHHTGIVDRHGNYPEFIEHFHKLFAKCQNSLRGRSENFWSSEQTSVVHLVDANDVLAKLTYAVTNPVKDQLVEKAHQWPGVSSLNCLRHGKPLKAKRPRHFFRETGAMPESATLKIVRPAEFAHLTDADFVNLVDGNIALVEEAAARHRRFTGTRAMGPKAVLAQDWRDCPRTQRRRGELKPTVAAQSKWRRIEALRRSGAFKDAYRAARARLIAGVKDVAFPVGTYWLKRFACVLCEPVPGS
jgi:putative transposase